jgi:APA family basic amino acid/polyamine antiporter
VFLSLGRIPALGDLMFTLIGRPPATPQTIEIGLSWQRIVGIATVVLLTWVNVRGVKEGAWIQKVLTGVKVLGVGGLIVLGVAIGLAKRPEAAAANFGGFFAGVDWSLALLPVLGAAMVGSLFSSDAWNNVAFAASEVQNPRKNLPLAMVLGTALVGVIYVSANLAYLTTLPLAEIQNAAQDRVGTAAAQVIFGDAGLAIMAVFIMISTFGCNNGLILAGARTYYAMARDGVFFRAAGKLNHARVPGWALAVQGIWAAALTLPRTYNPETRRYGNLYSDLLDYVISAALIFYVLTIAGVFRLRRMRPHAERPYRAFGYPAVPALYILGATVILLVLFAYRTATTWPGLIIVIAGVPVFYLFSRRD